MAASEDWIKSRAYALWEEEGRPHGKDAEHWERAAKEFKEKGLSKTNGAKKPAASRRKTPEPAAAAAEPSPTSEAMVKSKPKAKAAPKKPVEAPAPAAKKTRKTPAS